MWSTGVDVGGREVHVRLSPGVYRAAYSAPLANIDAGPDCASTVAMPPKDVAKALSDARSRFHQLRDLRRELSGRHLPNTDGFSAAAAPAVHASSAFPSTLPTATLAQASLSVTCTPSAASFGLPLDRLSADDPVTRSVLRTAAAERALRLQQAENDELKRAMVTQQQEAAQMQCLIDRLSAELTEMRQTVLRQTATMKSLAAEMERRDVYHLIKEKHRSQAAASAVATANASPGTLSSQSSLSHQQRLAQLEQQLEQLTKEKAELQQQVSHLSSRHGGKRQSTPAIEVIDKDDDLVGEGSGADGSVLSARVELQRLVQALGAILQAGASPLARIGACSEPIYELELSRVTRLAPARTQRDPDDDARAPGKVNSVVCICGPYSMRDVLLRVQLVTENAGSLMRRSRGLEGGPLQSPGRCVLYAMRDTCSAVRICLYKGVANTEVETGEPCSTESPAPTATATVAVHTLIATALASGNELETRHAAYSVHTVHLVDDKGGLRDTVTFWVRVTEVQHRRYSGYRGISCIDSDVDGRRCASPFQSPRTLEPGGVRIRERSATPLSSADAGSAEGESVTKNLQRGQRLGPMLSPSRNDDATPMKGQRLFAHSSFSCSTAPPAPTDDANSRGSAEKAKGILEQVEPQTKPLPALLTPSEDSKKAVTRAAAAVFCSGSKTPITFDGTSESQITDDSALAAARTTTLLPVYDTPAPMPPRLAASSDPSSTVGVRPTPSAPNLSWPPPPPVAVVPAPPLSSTPTSTPPADAAYAMRMRIKEVHFLHEGCEDDLVEDMLEQCSLQVVVRVDGEPVFTAPTRRNSSHAVWGAEEGSFTRTLTTGQEVRFEVLHGDKARSQAVLPASEILNASGEKELTLLSVSGGSPCGLLTMVFEGSV
ncbi:conserved hypothetical protein [Leishmania infantum JPCM5]|uniref:Uncharacterized protein n=2 Tax=Leishmania infantum TaxID=5671 RepID=A4ICP9_LEIIN|nr:conserved hypothetical protein [Leishmania infantum JPCM5]CAC9549156.1 hypothetical_protein_-_conserved [Leishmania infantum]CAM72627.1 conserved hypothetical protein [Leishmania infantum JPCM5]SUZ46462.1 hypothetical_protein_-_conserved [Leishmania infantum]|eukprot:XP_001469518.1 conserved hypothetical protein [Leishmania infantum JPCM5]